MRITIHRGFRQIGGCITEISSKAGTKIIIDLGHNLPGTNNGKDELANGEAVKELTKGCSAILYTHYHGDHVDLFQYVDGVKQYIGAGAKEVMNCKYSALARHDDQYKEALDKIASFDNYQMAHELHIGDITITPFMVSHSAFDAYMFLVKADGKTVLHTGDYRDHSYIGKRRLSCKSPWIGANQLPKDFGYPEHEERDILYTSYLRSEALHLRVQ